MSTRICTRISYSTHTQNTHKHTTPHTIPIHGQKRADNKRFQSARSCDLRLAIMPRNCRYQCRCCYRRRGRLQSCRPTTRPAPENLRVRKSARVLSRGGGGTRREDEEGGRRDGRTGEEGGGRGRREEGRGARGEEKRKQSIARQRAGTHRVH